jgi:hypothetical protein
MTDNSQKTLTKKQKALGEQVKKEKQEKNRNWPQFKEDYYNELGRKYDEIMIKTEEDKLGGFWNYMK